MPACLRMVLLSLGADVPEADLRRLCDCTVFGSTALQGLNAVRQLGFHNSRKYTLNLTELADCLADGYDPIVFVSLLPLDNRPDIHAMVVTGFDAQHVYVLDPRSGERTLTHEQFSAAWIGSNNLALIVVR